MGKRPGGDVIVRDLAFTIRSHRADHAQDRDATESFARRCYEICPDYFVVKVPLTPAGLLATRSLRADGIPVNLTLGFSARQNYLATALANPSYVNVFLGRLNSFVTENELGDGAKVGEKATLASQHEVNIFSHGLPQSETKQIAASLRDAQQLTLLAGVDVITMPPQVASEARNSLTAEWQSRREEDYDVSLSPDANGEAVRLETLWSVTPGERNLIQDLILHVPQSPGDLIDTVRNHEVGEIFPDLSEEELEAIASDGKIPKHERWSPRIARRELAIDSLMTLAALAYFADSQSKLDDRIRQHI